jgi:hypothetical protein
MQGEYSFGLQLNTISELVSILLMYEHPPHA